MNRKYFSKALFYSERKTYLAISIITFLFLGLNFAISYSNNSMQDMNYKNDYGFTLLVICSIILYISYSSKKEKYYFAATQPYKRDTVIFTKLISASISFIIPVLIFTIITTILYFYDSKLFNGNFSISAFWINFLFLIIEFISFVVSIQFSQVIFGKCIYSVLVPFITLILMIPIILMEIITYLLMMDQSIYNTLKPFLDSLVSFAEKTQMNTFIDFISIFIFLPITIYLNRKVNLEKTGDMFLFKPVKIIFKSIFSVFCGYNFSLIILIAVRILINPIIDTLHPFVFGILLIIGAAASIISYKIISIIEKRRSIS